MRRKAPEPYLSILDTWSAYKAALCQEQQEAAKTRWQSIVRAYETLTDREKFDNWINYGNPEGSSLARSIDFAMPSWLLDENY